MRISHGIPAERIRFECANALTFTLPTDTGAHVSLCMRSPDATLVYVDDDTYTHIYIPTYTALVYVDDEAWDDDTKDRLTSKLANELAPGVCM